MVINKTVLKKHLPVVGFPVFCVQAEFVCLLVG